jgi:hypothetical protein
MSDKADVFRSRLNQIFNESDVGLVERWSETPTLEPAVFAQASAPRLS